MVFNSLQFAVFFVIVYALYRCLNHTWQNRMLLAASYVFYGMWNWRFLFLILLSTVLDYACGLLIHDARDARRRKLLLIVSMVGNLTILGVFKYYDFFASSLQDLLAWFGLSVQPIYLKVALPLGVSFYTFQTMSYTIDIYRGQMRPTRRFVDFALFVAFFTQLVQGPIERARGLLPQILSPRALTPKKTAEGCYLIFWGLFQKIVVADNLARIVNSVFAAPPPYDGVAVLLAVYAFTFQIFCDFAGYTNMARGLAKCLGFELTINFNLPYFATNPSEFWRRWHITLSTWLRDYLYIPLGGNRKGAARTYRNLALTMLLGGLWHGAAWTFVLWGAYHGMLLIAHRLLQPALKRIPEPESPLVRKAVFLLRVAFFFHLICIGWLLFRAKSVGQVGQMLTSLCFNLSASGFAAAQPTFVALGFLLWFLLLIQVFQYRTNDPLFVLKLPAWVRGVVYLILILTMIVAGVQGGQDFIYRQF